MKAPGSSTIWRIQPSTTVSNSVAAGDDCHVIANTAWRNPAAFPGGFWHCDAAPHVPRAEGVPWADRIPYTVFAVATHIYLQD